MGRVDSRQGSPTETSSDASGVSMRISKRIQIWDRRKKLAVKI